MIKQEQETKKVIYNRITDYVKKYAEQIPNIEASVYENQRITYKDLNEKVELCSKALLNLGIIKGDRVAMLCTPSIEFYVVCLATINIGAVWVGLNPKYCLNEYQYVIGDAQPKLLFACAKIGQRSYIDDVLSLYEEHSFLENIVAINDPIEGAINYQCFLNASSVISDDKYIDVTQNVQPQEPALIVYTSGTTGKPKGAVLSHKGLCYGALVQTQHFNVSAPSVICNMPINHVACIADICSTTLVAGGTVYFQESFDPELMLKTIELEKINIWAGVPTMFLLQLNHPEYASYDLSSVNLILWGGSAMPEQSIKELEKIGSRMMVAYGMTETSAHTVYSSDDTTLDDLRDSIGFPDDKMPCRIVTEQGIGCNPGEQGEIQFKGDFLFLGYFNKPEATQEAFTEDGWFHTGDLGYWRNDGSISLVGRMSEMYKSGGYNVYPREIEMLLETHPSIDIAVVVSIDDPLFQEVGVAFVTLKQNTEVTTTELLELSKSSLANYKIPKKFLFIEKMPMLPIGKVDKVELKRQAID